MRQLQPFHAGLVYIHLFLRLQPEFDQGAVSRNSGEQNRRAQPAIGLICRGNERDIAGNTHVKPLGIDAARARSRPQRYRLA
jgi:hypothetical protein